jgi:hypothetical protein
MASDEICKVNRDPSGVAACSEPDWRRRVLLASANRGGFVFGYGVQCAGVSVSLRLQPEHCSSQRQALL